MINDRIKILKKTDYKRGAVDFNDYLNNLIHFFEDKRDINESDVVLFKDGGKVYIVKYRHKVSVEDKELCDLIETNGGNPLDSIEEYHRYISVNNKPEYARDSFGEWCQTSAIVYRSKKREGDEEKCQVCVNPDECTGTDCHIKDEV